MFMEMFASNAKLVSFKRFMLHILTGKQKPSASSCLLPGYLHYCFGDFTDLRINVQKRFCLLAGVGDSSFVL